MTTCQSVMHHDFGEQERVEGNDIVSTMTEMAYQVFFANSAEARAVFDQELHKDEHSALVDDTRHTMPTTDEPVVKGALLPQVVHQGKHLIAVRGRECIAGEELSCAHRAAHELIEHIGWHTVQFVIALGW